MTSKAQPALGGVYKLGAIFDSKLTPEALDKIRADVVAGRHPSDPDFVRDVIKLSEDQIKVTVPGELDILRYITVDTDGNTMRYDGDTLISNLDADPVNGNKLARDITSIHKKGGTLQKTFNAGSLVYRPLVRTFENGQLVAPMETVHHARERAIKSLAMLDETHKRL